MACSKFGIIAYSLNGLLLRFQKIITIKTLATYRDNSSTSISVSYSGYNIVGVGKSFSEVEWLVRFVLMHQSLGRALGRGHHVIGHLSH